jgi:hypothetical protein
MATRTRVDVWSISVGTLAKARSESWHPALDTYARGVQAMMDRDVQLPPDSWRYVANTHGIDPATQPRPGVWAQCAHRRRMFLPWHRAYLAWLERTIITLTGDTSWALPYWDYTRPTPAKLRTVPPEFRVPTRRVGGVTVRNPLFVADRAASVPAGDVEVVPALAEAQFVRSHPQGGFSPPGFGGSDVDGTGGLIEMEPHNLVHGDLGGLMGFTSTAGRDPIFWLHHANIDRLWEVWRGLAGSVDIRADTALPSAIKTEWTSAKFVFGQGTARTRYAIRDCEAIASAPMEYRYDTLALPAATAAAVAAARQRAAAQPGGGGMGLDQGAQRFEPVGAADGATSGEPMQVRADRPVMGLDAALPSQLYLELAGVRGARPHHVYAVMVSVAPGATEHQVGRFSTFGLDEADDDEQPTIVVDATSSIDTLLADGWDGGDFVVRIVPEPGRADADDAGRSVNVDQVIVYASR